MSPESPVAPPPERFNFAQHLISLNAARSTKAAFIDDQGTLTFGELAERIRRFAGALASAGVKREERVLLLMHDCNDWPVAFLGAMYAGVVPVAVNTLLTAEDYAYMLQHSRAQAAIVSAALLPTLQSAIEIASKQNGCEVNAIFVSNAQAASGALPSNAKHFDEALTSATPLAHAANTAANDPGFWLYSSGSTGKPKGTVHTHANPYWTAELYGKGILQLRENDVCFSA
ncbi:MAG: AMP-binding protein, partial [Casimicrobium sp.]